MNAFGAGTQWFKLPSGNIVQSFQSSVSQVGNGGTLINLPVSFPNALYAVSAMWFDGTTTAAPTYKVVAFNNSSITIRPSFAGAFGTMFLVMGI
jgi:hypothetical protein